MARNKNSTALFDVIHAAKKPPKSSPSASIPAPRWWGKDKKPLKSPAADPTENVGKQQSWLTAAKRNGGVGSAPAAVASSVVPETALVEDSPMLNEPAPSAVTQQEETILAAVAEPAAPRPRFIDRFKARATTSAVDEAVLPTESQARVPEPTPIEYTLPTFDSPAEEPQMPVEHKPSRKPPGKDAMVAIDRVTGDVKFHLSYGGMIAIGFILLMALAIAFIAGTRTPNNSSAESDPGDAKPLHSNSATATELTTTGMAMAVVPAKSADADRHVSPEVMEVSPRTPKPSPQAAVTPTAPTAPLRVSATRDIGMIYVVIQSYDDQELAQKACDFVNHAGVPCTLVQGLSGWAMRDWYSVVGLQPFKKHDPALDEYEKSITALGLKFSNKIYNQFQPQGYTWRADSDTAAQ
jgi:hypothetical protein